MSSSSNTLLLITLIFSSIFHFSSSHFMNINAREDQIEVVSCDDNVNEKMGSAVFTRLRYLFGLQSSKSKSPSLSFSPAPTPAPTPSFLTHIYTRTPLSHKSHKRKHAHKSKDGQRGHRDTSRLHSIIIDVLVSIGSILVVVFLVSVFFVCRRYRRQRVQSSRGKNKVSYDPDPSPELFYLESLTPILDVESSFKHPSLSKNMLWNESVSSNISSNDGPQLKSESEMLSCRDEETLNKPRESKNVLRNENISCSNLSDIVSCLDEEILHMGSSSSDDETFHSARNSHSSVEQASNVWESNLRCESGKCSPYSSSNWSSSPFAHPPLCPSRTNNPPSPSKNSRNNSRCASQSTIALSNHPSNQELNSILESTKLVTLPSSSIGNIPRQPPPPPFPMISNGNIPRAPPRPMPSNGNGNIPNPPPPPLPDFAPRMSQNGSNSRQPPPPPIHFQQSTPLGKDGSPLPKLKPLHWDKVRAAPDRSMVWDKIRSSSFELDEQMMESLFSYNTQSSAKNDEAKARSSSPDKHVLDNKRLHNITILLKALNATSEKVCEALMQGRGLGTLQLEALVKMIPTKEEEEKLSNYQGDIGELGSAEKFVKAILNIPFAFSRMRAMLYRETFEDEVVHLKKSFEMLEEACRELRSSRLFFRLLEAVLKTGNRMNVGTIRGGARAFKLDTLLKLADVKGTDGKTSLLHFVVQEIIRAEGVNAMEKSIKKNKPRTVEEREEGYRVMGLDIVSGLSTELCNVKKTASIDLDVLGSSVSNLMEELKKLKHLVVVDLSGGERNESFVNSLKSFLIHAERTIDELKEDETRVLIHVREITEYYHGDVSKDEANLLRIFVIVRDFLGMLDRVCKEIRNMK